jgi:hypothetical protein
MILPDIELLLSRVDALARRRLLCYTSRGAGQLCPITEAFTMQWVRILLSIAVLALSVAGCGDEVDREEVGSPCSEEEETLCDSLCLLDLPDGMCSHDCAEDPGVCPDGFACGDISGGRYCLQSCEEDDDCRDEMICVIGECRTPMPLRAACEEHDDCESGVCYEERCDTAVGFGWDCDDDEDCHSGFCYDGSCNVECHSPRDCGEELSCIDLGDGIPVCLEYSPPDGPYGENCTYESCDEDFTCLARTPAAANDPYAYCTRGCDDELDCPADMACRRTQRPNRNESELRCVPRLYCERCSYDGQCEAGGRCVSQAPDRGPGRYCSQTCDPERAVNTCPTDSTCHEALWCAPDRAWVADCEWCSDPDLCETIEDEPVYQCFHDYGACAGEGSDDDYCAPCFVDDDCPEGGFCNYDQFAHNSYCTAPCPDGEEGGCEYEHACFYFEDVEEPQCAPRAGSCSHPSGGVTTCYPCDDFTDCVSGQCLPWDLAQGSWNSCWEDCEFTDCGPYSECYQLSDTSTEPPTVFHLCGAPDGFTCVQVEVCVEECPEGPDSCSDDAPARCR